MRFCRENRKSWLDLLEKLHKTRGFLVKCEPTQLAEHLAVSGRRVTFNASEASTSQNSYKASLLPRFPLLPPFPSALFAYWLRSSVVSVLFSLITKSFPLGCIMIILIFVPRRETSGLAHVSCHCVTGISLPPVDAKSFHCCICMSDLRRRVERNIERDLRC